MALIRCSQEFHKWIMEKAFDGNNPVSVVLDRMMVREKEEPDEKPEVKVEVLEDVCEKLDQLAIEVKKMRSVLEGTSSEKCPSCGGIVKDNQCQTCKAKKVRGMFVFDKKYLEEGEGEGEEGEEKLEKVKSELGQVDQGSFICDCGEKIVIEENTERSLLDGIEWVICPECNSRRRKEYLEK